jgi:hypothetical protein
MEAFDRCIYVYLFKGVNPSHFDEIWYKDHISADVKRVNEKFTYADKLCLEVRVVRLYKYIHTLYLTWRCLYKQNCFIYIRSVEEFVWSFLYLYIHILDFYVCLMVF